MRIRFEVAARKTWGWPHFIARAEKVPGYRVSDRGGKAELHALEFSSVESCLPVWQVIQGWKAVWVYVNGSIWTSLMFKMQVLKHQHAPFSARQLMDDALAKVARKKNQGDDENRWRMGLGPTPGLD